MKKLILLPAFIILIIIPDRDLLYAQNFEWATPFGGTGNENGLSVATDADGNIYATGSFEGSVDFDPGAGAYILTSLGYRDIFITKQDPDGNLIWAMRIGGEKEDVGLSIATDSEGNVLTTGNFRDTVDFDPGAGVFLLSVEDLYYGPTGTPYLRGHDVFISKLSSDGLFIWAKQFGGNLVDYGSGISVDEGNNVLTTGEFSVHYAVDSADFDPGPGVFNMGRGGGFISKLDSDGNFVWARQFGYITGASSACGTVCIFSKNYTVSFRSVATDVTGNVYTTGSFTRINNDFDPGLSVYNLHALGTRDIFVCQLDAAGNFVWAKQMGGSGASAQAEDIALDGSGNVHTTGFYAGKVDYNPGTGTANLTSANPPGTYDAFVSKLTNTGNYAWAKSFGSGGDDRGYSVSVDAQSNVYSTGSFTSRVDFDPGSPKYNLTALGIDVYVSKLTGAGNFGWAVRMGGTGEDRGNAIALDIERNVLTTGNFTLTGDFDPGTGTHTLFSAGAADAFVHKMNQTIILAPVSGPEAGDHIEAEIRLYPNPAQEKVTVSFSSLDVYPYEIHIVDLSGKLMKKHHGLSNIGYNKCEIQLEHLSKGIYQIILIMNENLITKTLMLD